MGISQLQAPTSALSNEVRDFIAGGGGGKDKTLPQKEVEATAQNTSLADTLRYSIPTVRPIGLAGEGAAFGKGWGRGRVGRSNRNKHWRAGLDA